MSMDKPKGCPRISVIICALNEEQNLSHVLPKVPDWVDELILVDGHSTDRTVEVAKNLRPDIRVLFQLGRGKGDALKHGIKQATGDIIVTIDADGETNPEDIPRFIEPLLNGYDFAKGSRLLWGRPLKMPWHRWFGNRILDITCNFLHDTKYTDVCSGYNAFLKSAFLRLELKRDGFEMEQEMLVKAKKAGLKVVEVEHHDLGRLGSTSKVSTVKQGFTNLLVIMRECFRG
jgi:glycosyltransferase involved in cell wall biosynthesis